MSAETETVGLPDDADDLRGLHFRLLMGKGLTWVAIGVAVAAGLVAGASFFSPAIGAAAGVGALLLSLLAVFAIADSRSEGSFFEIYAQQRGLLLTGKSRLPGATPLLRKGDDRYAERLLTGPIADGFEGSLALYTYEEESTDSEGNSQTDYYRFTVGLIDVPECAAFVPELYCQRRFGLKALEGLEDAFRKSRERVELESEALGDMYEIFSGDGQDANRLRQLFSPTFIVWLTDSAPKKFAFELVNGTLCCYVKGHKKNTGELDIVSQASAAVATRLREEATE